MNSPDIMDIHKSVADVGLLPLLIVRAPPGWWPAGWPVVGSTKLNRTGVRLVWVTGAAIEFADGDDVKYEWVSSSPAMRFVSLTIMIEDPIDGGCDVVLVSHTERAPNVADAVDGAVTALRDELRRLAVIADIFDRVEIIHPTTRREPT